jgi:hypothetical protein
VSILILAGAAALFARRAQQAAAVTPAEV